MIFMQDTKNSPDIKTILFSPHSDDIAFSLGGILTTDYFDRPSLIITLFTESNYSPFIIFKDSNIISKKREKEDFTFAKSVDIELKRLSFPEAPVRGKPWFCKCPDCDPFSDPIFEKVQNSIKKIVNSCPNALVLSPMGLGNHLDHIIVLESCLSIWKERKIKMAFYEDMPYSETLTLEQIENRVNLLSLRLGTSLQPYNINITVNFNKKIENLKLYESQVGHKLSKHLRLHAARLGFKNEKLLDLIWKYKIPKNLFYTTVYIKGTLFERLWYFDSSAKNINKGRI